MVVSRLSLQAAGALEAEGDSPADPLVGAGSADQLIVSGSQFRVSGYFSGFFRTEFQF